MNRERVQVDPLSIEGEKAFRRITVLMQNIENVEDYQREKAKALGNPNRNPNDFIRFNAGDQSFWIRFKHSFRPAAGTYRKVTVQSLELASETHSVYLGSEYYEDVGLVDFDYGFSYAQKRHVGPVNPLDMDGFLAEQFPELYPQEEI